MKKLLLFLIVLLFAVPAFGATVTWIHDGLHTDGYAIMWWETDNPPVPPAKPFCKVVTGNTARSLEIEDIRFKPNVEYTFTGIAWNATARSDQSTPAVWTREVEEIAPPVDNLPTDVYIYKPNSIILNMGN